MNIFSNCLFGHGDWITVRIKGVLTRQCERCQQPMGAILVNAEAPEIVAPKKLPKVKPMLAKKLKVKRGPARITRIA